MIYFVVPRCGATPKRSMRLDPEREGLGEDAAFCVPETFT